MSLVWTIVAICAFAMLVYGFAADFPRTPQGIPRLSPREVSCPGMEGNSDFYGLGIRIGVYLQWFSSWISNTINPSGAAANHDANTIFLTAILIATTVALAGGGIQPVEAYIMLLLSYGFVFTVLSFLGLRLYLLQPSSTRQLRETLWATIISLKIMQYELAAALITVMASLAPVTNPQPRPVLSLGTTIKKFLVRARVTFGFRAVSGIKHPALSWAGVFARCTIGTLLAIVSILSWWKHSVQSLPDSGGPCVPKLFFFGLQSVTGSMLLFFKVAAILLAIPVFYFLLFFVEVMMRFSDLGADWLMRYGLIKMAETIAPGAWDTLSDEEKASLRAKFRPETLLSTGHNITGIVDPRPLIHLLHSIVDRSQVTLRSTASAPLADLNSARERPQNGILPHKNACGSHHIDVSTHESGADNIRAVVCAADGQATRELAEATQGQRPRHFRTTEMCQARQPGQMQDKSSWQIRASELPRFSVLLQSFMSLWTRGIETDHGLECEKLKPG